MSDPDDDQPPHYESIFQLTPYRLGLLASLGWRLLCERNPAEYMVELRGYHNPFLALDGQFKLTEEEAELVRRIIL